MELPELSNQELRRYERHFMLPEIGMEGQQKLKASRVLVIGAGGLGTPVLLYIASAGVGTIGILDEDKVEESDLPRQILYHSHDIGKHKTIVAREKLKIHNPNVNVEIFNTRLAKHNAVNFVKNYDIIVDCTDNLDVRYALDSACVEMDKPLVYGAIYKYEGQAAVLNYEQGPTYRCIYPEPPSIGARGTDASKMGVIGSLPAIIGSIQANEVLKMITKFGEVTNNALIIFDIASMKYEKISVKRSI